MCPLFPGLCCFIVFPLQLCLLTYIFWGPLIGFLCRHVFTSYSLISKISFRIFFKLHWVLVLLSGGSCHLLFYFFLQTMAFLNLIFIECTLYFSAHPPGPSTGKCTKKVHRTCHYVHLPIIITAYETCFGITMIRYTFPACNLILFLCIFLF